MRIGHVFSFSGKTLLSNEKAFWLGKSSWELSIFLWEPYAYNTEHDRSLSFVWKLLLFLSSHGFPPFIKIVELHKEQTATKGLGYASARENIHISTQLFFSRINRQKEGKRAQEIAIVIHIKSFFFQHGKVMRLNCLLLIEKRVNLQIPLLLRLHDSSSFSEDLFRFQTATLAILTQLLLCTSFKKIWLI